jgi:hypothetical protein
VTGASCQATWSLVNSWSGGFQLGFTVTDPGTVATSNWTVSYSWPGSQTISEIWNASDTQSGSSVSISNLSYDGDISAGGSTTFGLLGNGTAPTSLPNLACST